MTFRMLTFIAMFLVTAGNCSDTKADLSDLKQRQQVLETALTKFAPHL